MKKTLAQLKRDAKSGKLFAKLIIRQGTTDIHERLQGVRQIVGSNSVGITFLTKDEKKSELQINSASLVDYTDIHITIYRPGLRDLTEQEQAIFDKWEEEMDALTDGSASYWRKKYFFIDAGFEYLLGYETIKGKKYDFNTKKVYDNGIKGEIEMQYELVQP